MSDGRADASDPIKDVLPGGARNGEEWWSFHGADEPVWGLRAIDDVSLRGGYVPADLRAALFEAATQLPGVDVVEGPVDLDGHVGIAVGRAEPANHIRQELVFEETTGQVIGEREVLTADSADLGRPAGTVIRYSSVTTEVVNSAP